MRMIGRRVTYSLDGKPVQGECIAARATGTTILDMPTGQEWPGIQFQVRADDGRTFWTVTYPDKDRELE